MQRQSTLQTAVALLLGCVTRLLQIGLPSPTAALTTCAIVVHRHTQLQAKVLPASWECSQRKKCLVEATLSSTAASHHIHTCTPTKNTHIHTYEYMHQAIADLQPYACLSLSSAVLSVCPCFKGGSALPNPSCGQDCQKGETRHSESDTFCMLHKPASKPSYCNNTTPLQPDYGRGQLPSRRSQTQQHTRNLAAYSQMTQVCTTWHKTPRCGC